MRGNSIFSIAVAAVLLLGGPSARAEEETNPAALAQAAAMAKAKVSLDVAADHAVKANTGYRAVSVMPKLEGDSPVAVVTLMKGVEVKKVSEKLN